MALSSPLSPLLALVLDLALVLPYSNNVEGRLSPFPPVPAHSAALPALTTAAALLKAASPDTHVLYLSMTPLENEVKAIQGASKRGYKKDWLKSKAIPGHHTSPTGLTGKTRAPAAGTRVTELPTEVYGDADAALTGLKKRLNRYCSVNVVVRGSATYLQDVVKQAIQRQVLVPERVWVLVSDTRMFPDALLPSVLLTNQHNLLLVMPLSGTPLKATPDESIGVCVASVYRLIFAGGELQWVLAGCGRVDGGLSLSLDPFALPTTLSNMTLPVAIVKGSPTLSLTRTPEGTPYLDGFLGEVMRLLQQDLQFGVQVSQAVGFGNQLANGSWIGLVGVVARKEVEVGLASLTISHGRSQVVEFTEHLIEAGTYLLYPARRVIQPVYMVFLVFSPELWGCLVGQMALLGTVLFLTSSIDVTWRSDRPFYYLSAAYRSLVYQGNLEPRSSAPRLTYLSCLIFSLIVYALYSGNLTAVLSLPRLKEYPTNAEEMLEQGYAPILTRGFFQYDYFKFSPLETFRTLFRHAEERGTIYPFGRIDHKLAMERFSQGQVASVISRMGVVIRQNSGAGPQQPCPFYMSPSPINSGHVSVILQKHSFFSEMFNNRLRWLRDTGNIQEIYDRSNAIQCVTGASKERSRPLPLNVLVGAFLVWVVGAVLATTIFLTESLAACGRRQQRVK